MSAQRPSSLTLLAGMQLQIQRNQINRPVTNCGLGRSSYVCHSIHFFLAFVFLAYSPSAQTISQFDTLARYQQWVADVPGYVVEVFAGNKVIYEKTNGLLLDSVLLKMQRLP